MKQSQLSNHTEKILEHYFVYFFEAKDTVL